MNRYTSFGIILAASLISVWSAYGQNKGVKEGSFRVVLSKVSSIGTAQNNSNIKPVSEKGARISALVAGERWSQGAGGSFSATEKIGQINFMLPSRMSIVDATTEICLDRIQALRSAGAAGGKLELNFKGRQLDQGNYLVAKVLGCGEISTVSVLPVVKPTPKPARTPAPKK